MFTAKFGTSGPTGLTGRVDRSDPYSPSRIRHVLQSPFLILLVNGTSSPAYKYKG